MSSFFTLLYPNLVAELRKVANPKPDLIGSVFVVISVVQDGRTIWESDVQEIYKFRWHQLPRWAIPKPRSRRKLYLSCFMFSADGFTRFIKRHRMYVKYVRSKYTFFVSPARLSRSKVIRSRFPPLRVQINSPIPISWILAMRRSLLLLRSQAFVTSLKAKKVPTIQPSGDYSQTYRFPYRHLQHVNGSLVINSPANDFIVVRSKVSNRTLTPNFHNLKKWQLPVNPYSVEFRITSSRLGFERARGLTEDQEHEFVGHISRFTSIPDPDFSYDPESDGKAYRALLRTLDQSLSRSSSQTPTNIAQANQVVRMIGKNALRILSAYRSVKRGDFASASRKFFGASEPRFRKKGGPSATRSLASNWLEYQYGWKPLLYDIKALVDAFATTYHPQPRSIRASATSIRTSDTILNGPFNISLNSVPPFPAGKRSVVRRTSVSYGIRYQVSDEDTAILAQTGFLSPVSLAWELIPFSFVVDWFYPIGPYLEGLSAFKGLTFLDGYKSTFIREESATTISASGLRGSTFVWDHEAKAGELRTAIRFEREKIFSFPDRPVLRFQNPFLNVTRSLNAVALLVTTLKKDIK